MSRIGTALRAFARAWRGPKGPVSELREFVYLDETSVESLLASLDGEVLVGTTQTRGRVGELGVGATGDAVGIPTGLAPSLKVGRSSSVQEERKSVAQSAFARLRARQLASMPIAVGAGRPGRDGVQIDNLRRGDLVEVAVRLEGADVFQVQAIIRSMIEVVDSYPDLLETSQQTAILNGEPIAALLESLSRGLIPIEGEAIDLQVVDRDGTALLVSGASHESGLPVRIAGVTLEGLYWQDVRRVLFSRGEYRMLVRLLHDGVRERWSPVKITEILSQVSSDLAATIDGLGPAFLGSLRDGARQTIVSEDLKAARTAALTDFAARLRSAVGAAELDRHTGSRVASVAAQVSSEADEGAEWWKGALNRMADAALGEADQSVSPVDLAALRGEFAEPTLQGSAAGGEPPSTPHLEVEVVAIYW